MNLHPSDERGQVVMAGVTVLVTLLIGGAALVTAVGSSRPYGVALQKLGRNEKMTDDDWKRLQDGQQNMARSAQILGAGARLIGRSGPVPGVDAGTSYGAATLGKVLVSRVVRPGMQRIIRTVGMPPLTQDRPHTAQTTSTKPTGEVWVCKAEAPWYSPDMLVPISVGPSTITLPAYSITRTSYGVDYHLSGDGAVLRFTPPKERYTPGEMVELEMDLEGGSWSNRTWGVNNITSKGGVSGGWLADPILTYKAVGTNRVGSVEGLRHSKLSGPFSVGGDECVPCFQLSVGRDGSLGTVSITWNCKRE